MQTFLPYANFRESAVCLDYKRLGKQRVEAWQIYRALLGETKGWVNHPATRMWKTYEHTLIIYGLSMTMEWIRRGFNDTMTARFELALQQFKGRPIMPPWFGHEDFHLSHRSNLLRKDGAFYAPLFGDIPNNLPYIWPNV